MKYYFKRLWRSICNKNYYIEYEQPTESYIPLIWDMDAFILNLIKYNLPNYIHGHPSIYTQEEWDREKMGCLKAIDRYAGLESTWRLLGCTKEKREAYKKERLGCQKLIKEFVGKNLFYLRD